MFKEAYLSHAGREIKPIGEKRGKGLRRLEQTVILTPDASGIRQPACN